jgi:hypothetical protein
MWWGSGRVWHTTLSPDGKMRWDGLTWVYSSAGDPPSVFEVMDPGSISANRFNRLPPRQLAAVILRKESDLFLFPFRYIDYIALGCLGDPVALLIISVLSLTVWVPGMPIVLLVCLSEALFGLTVIEGRLAKSKSRRRWWITIGSHRYLVPAAIARSLRDETEYRIYLTKLNSAVVNYERLEQ